MYAGVTETRSPPITVPMLRQFKQDGRKIAALTAYDASFAKLADEADVMLLAGVVLVQHGELFRADQAAVAPGQAYGLATGLVDQAHDVLLHLAGQHPFNDFHGFIVGHAHALDEMAFLAEPVERGFNLRAAAMHHHRVHADQLEQHHVLGEVGLQRRVGHGVAAVFDDQRLAVELADVRQRLRQNFSLVARADMGQVGAGRRRRGVGHGARIREWKSANCAALVWQVIASTAAAADRFLQSWKGHVVYSK